VEFAFGESPISSPQQTGGYPVEVFYEPIMSLVQFEQLEKSFGAQVLFSAFSAQISCGDRIALIGENGVGKSTLLSMIAEVETPSGGRVHRIGSVRIGYLPQIVRLEGEGSLYQAMLQTFSELLETEEELRRLELGMAETSDPEQLHRYDELLLAFEHGGGYTIHSRIRSVLNAIGFSQDAFDNPVDLLSGGEEARAALARVLLEKPDLLLLDEPTNHLDFAALDWLEETLVEFPGAIVLVSHDRHLLDRLANRTWEIAFGKVTIYPGGYSQSRTLREAERRRRLSDYEAQKATAERYKEFIRRHHAGQKHRQAKDRERKLERLERELVERPFEEKRIAVRIPTGTPSGKQVLTLDEAGIGYTTPLFRCPQVSLYRGERVAIIGGNGCGKTSFLKTIAGEIPPLSGRVQIGHGVRIATYSQTQEELRGSGTVLDAIVAASDLSIGQARGLLGRFLFSGDAVKKKMRALSGGERSRVALALLSLMEGNVLLLDEPTNHLDLASQVILEDALRSYAGTILLVSHDRALLEAVATRVWEIREGQLRDITRSFRDYRQRLINERVLSLTTAEKPQPKHVKKPSSSGKKTDRYRERQRLKAQKAIEEEIEALEAKLRALEQELLDASRSGDGKRIAALGEEHRSLTRSIKARYAEWERLSTQRE